MSAIAAHDAFWGCDPVELFEQIDEDPLIWDGLTDSEEVSDNHAA